LSIIVLTLFVDKTAVENYNKGMVEEQKPDNKPIVPEGNDTGSGNQEEQGLKKHLSHDGLFRFAFDNKNVAESFARENLPGEITNELDFSSMTQDKDTFVDQRLSRCYSDVKYIPTFSYELFDVSHMPEE
jgi:hypothetical protein